MKSLAHYWYTSKPVLRAALWPVLLLLPLSWLYCLLVQVRRGLYRFRLLAQRRWQTPVIVVGNIVAGGSGKTPLLIALCAYLKAQGRRPGVVSRGYGGSVQGVHALVNTDTPTLVGDEPLMIFQRCNVPVVVAADRPAAVDRLLAMENCDIVLSDDGLQHYRMGRAFEIAVIDSQRGLGNGFCLPAGPLREPAGRLASVDLVVFNGRGEYADSELYYTLQPGRIVRLSDAGHEVGQDYFTGKSVHAVAGIGNPPRFFEQLRAQGLTIIEHPFEDHHAFTAEDFAGWSAECIIMTEKDAVKCRQLLLEEGQGGAFLADAWVQSVDAVFSDALKQAVDNRLLKL